MHDGFTVFIFLGWGGGDQMCRTHIPVVEKSNLNDVAKPEGLSEADVTHHAV